MKNIFIWDGERVKQTQKEVVVKHTPKDILNALDDIRGNITQAQNSEEQLKQQMAANSKIVMQLTEAEKNLKEFEEKCLVLQKIKILEIIKTIHVDCIKKATESSVAMIAKDSNAYNEAQKKNLPYLDYQKLLATHVKMADKISARMIRQHLYEKPIFNNPFED